MEIFEIFFRALIIDFFGVNTRYYFFKIFNKNIKKKDFIKDSVTNSDNIMQGVYNFIVGIIVSCLFIIGVAFIFYKLKLL